MRIKVYIAGALMTILVLSGARCKQTPRAPTAAIPSQVQRAITTDREQTYAAEVHIWSQYPNKRAKEIHLDVYRPDLNYARIRVLKGRGAGETKYIYRHQVVVLDPVHKEYLWQERASDKQDQYEKQRQALFQKQVQLTRLPDQEWEGYKCYVVEAKAKTGGLFFKRYWLTIEDQPVLVRIQTFHEKGDLVRDEQRLHCKGLSAAVETPPPPAVPPGWEKIVLPSPEPATPEEEAKLKAYRAPEGYQLLATFRDRSPCKCPLPSARGVYSNGLNSYTLFLIDGKCEHFVHLPKDGKVHLEQTEAGSFAYFQTPQGQLVAVMGEIEPEQVRTLLASAR